MSRAVIASTIANVNRKKHTAAYKPKDFMPKYGRQPVQGWQEQLNLIEMLNQALGGADERSETQKRWRE